MIRKKVIDTLNDLQILLNDINLLIVEYVQIKIWQQNPSTSWKTQYPRGILCYKQLIYHCQFLDGHSNSVFVYNSNGEILNKLLTLNKPSGIDIEKNKLLLYIADFSHVTVVNLLLTEIISQFPLPKPAPNTFSWGRGLKIDGNIYYLTIARINEIFLCKNDDGKLIKTYGSQGSHYFFNPFGITTDKIFLYICISTSHRIQISNKENGRFITQWGGTRGHPFTSPCSIYNDETDDIIYIGDVCSIQLFEKNGTCIQRFGNFEWAYSIGIMDNQLYVSDTNNLRIQIFKRDE